MSELVLPVKRGTFIEFRTGLINICPVGRSCSQEERTAFADFDSKYKIREKFVQNLESELSDLGLKFSIGELLFIFVKVAKKKLHVFFFYHDLPKLAIFGDLPDKSKFKNISLNKNECV